MRAHSHAVVTVMLVLSFVMLDTGSASSLGRPPYKPVARQAVPPTAAPAAAAAEPLSGPPGAAAGSADQPFEWTARTISAVVIAFMVASLAASAGVGGGAFFVPLYMLALGYGLKEASVLSQCTIAAVSAASIVFNLPKRHPTNPDATLIDYQQLLTMAPALLSGVSLGVIFNVTFPTWLITTMLISLLGFMFTRTAQKGLQLWRSETRSKQQAAAAASAPAAGQEAITAEDAPLLGGDGTAAASEASTAAVVLVTDEPPEAAGKPHRAGFPWGMAAGVVFLWCGFGALQLLRTYTAKCSPAFYAVIGSQVAFGLGSSAFFAYFFLVKPARAAEGNECLSAPLLANSSTNSLSGLLSRAAHHQQADMVHLMGTALKVALSGVVAGVVGIGGGLLMAPMLLDAGIHPQSTSATSNILVFMSSSSAALAFFLNGRVPLQYAAVFCSLCGTASLLGLTGVGRLVKASGRPSIVVLLLALIMGAGAVCSGVFGYLDAYEHGDVGFKSIC